MSNALGLELLRDGKEGTALRGPDVCLKVLAGTGDGLLHSPCPWRGRGRGREIDGSCRAFVILPPQLPWSDAAAAAVRPPPPPHPLFPPMVMTSCVRTGTRTHLSSRPHPRCCQTALLLIIWSPLPSLVNVHTTTDHNYHPLIAAFQMIRGPVLVKLSPSRWQDAEVRTCEVLLNPEIEAGGVTVRH